MAWPKTNGWRSSKWSHKGRAKIKIAIHAPVQLRSKLLSWLITRDSRVNIRIITLSLRRKTLFSKLSLHSTWNSLPWRNVFRITKWQGVKYLVTKCWKSRPKTVPNNKNTKRIRPTDAVWLNKISSVRALSAVYSLLYSLHRYANTRNQWSRTMRRSRWALRSNYLLISMMLSSALSMLFRLRFHPTWKVVIYDSLCAWEATKTARTVTYKWSNTTSRDLSEKRKPKLGN